MWAGYGWVRVLGWVAPIVLTQLTPSFQMQACISSSSLFYVFTFIHPFSKSISKQMNVPNHSPQEKNMVVMGPPKERSISDSHLLISSANSTGTPNHSWSNKA